MLQRDGENKTTTLHIILKNILMNIAAKRRLRSLVECKANHSLLYADEYI
jgi:hypothetical protein